jgi:hypothetical protein
MTKLENEYAEVPHRKASLIMNYSSIDLSVPNLECLQFVFYAKPATHASTRHET